MASLRDCLVGRFYARLTATAILLGASIAGSPTYAQQSGQKWAASWTTSIQGAYSAPTTAQQSAISAYNPQPDLSFALPGGMAENQTLRMIIKPDLWGSTIRLKFSNYFNTSPVVFSAATVGLQSYQANVTPGTMSAITFNGKSSVTIPNGQSIYSDAVALNFVNAATLPLLTGRNLAVSFAISGASGPMSYHLTAFATSYLSPPNSGDVTQSSYAQDFPFSTTSFFFVDEMDVVAPQSTIVICAFGDSITDGTFSTLNGDDRWTNELSMLLHGRYGSQISVVNEGIGGNGVVTRLTGEPAVTRMARDVAQLSGVNIVVLLEGINDLGAGNTALAVMGGYAQIAAAVHATGAKIIGGTITPSAAPNFIPPSNSPLAVLTPAAGNYASRQLDQSRRGLNQYILSSGIFDGVADFSSSVIDTNTGVFQAPFTPNSEGSAGDYLHPNRAGYLMMGYVASDAIAKLQNLHFGR